MYHLGIAILLQGDMLGATVVEVLPSCAQLVSASLWISLDKPVWVACFFQSFFLGWSLLPQYRSDVVGLPLKNCSALYEIGLYAIIIF